MVGKKVIPFKHGNFGIYIIFWGVYRYNWYNLQLGSCQNTVRVDDKGCWTDLTELGVQQLPAVNTGLNAMPQLTTYNAPIPTTSYLDVPLEVSIKGKDQQVITLSYPIYM